MTNDRFLPFAFPTVASKKITAAFDGGRITSDGGVMVLAQAERRLAIAEKLAAGIAGSPGPPRALDPAPPNFAAPPFGLALRVPRCHQSPTAGVLSPLQLCPAS